MFCPNPDCPDFRDTGIHGEYVETIWACPVCGARLVAEEPVEQLPYTVAEPELTDAEREAFVPVATYLFREEAKLAGSFLTANGFTPFVERRVVLVPKDQAQAAKELLEHPEAEGGESAGRW